MGPWPIGTVGQYGMDVNPYMQGWRIWSQNQAQQQQMQQRAKEFSTQVGLQEQGINADRELAQLRLRQDEEARAANERVSMAGIRQRDLESQRRAEGDKAGLGLKERQWEDKLASEADARERSRMEKEAADEKRQRLVGITNSIEDYANTLRAQGMTPEEMRNELLALMKAEGRDPNDELYWRSEIDRVVSNAPKPPKGEGEGTGSKLSPSSQLTYWKGEEARASAELQDLKKDYALMKAWENDPDPMKKAIAAATLAEYGGSIESMEARMAELEAKAGKAGKFIRALMTGEEMPEWDMLPDDPTQPAEWDMLPGDPTQPAEWDMLPMDGKVQLFGGATRPQPLAPEEPPVIPVAPWQPVEQRPSFGRKAGPERDAGLTAEPKERGFGALREAEAAEAGKVFGRASKGVTSKEEVDTRRAWEDAKGRIEALDPNRDDIVKAARGLLDGSIHRQDWGIPDGAQQLADYARASGQDPEKLMNAVPGGVGGDYGDFRRLESEQEGKRREDVRMYQARWKDARKRIEATRGDHNDIIAAAEKLLDGSLHPQDYGIPDGAKELAALAEATGGNPKDIYFYRQK